MKTVTYNGKEYTVPKWTRCMATDEDGCIYAYSKDAEVSDVCVGWSCCGKFKFIAEDYTITDWMNSKESFE